MTHKTLINGTSYDITGGTTLVEGTSYNIKNGKALIDGTAYDISFAINGVLDVWGNTGEITCITYADGYYVVGGYQYVDSKYQACIAYTTELSGTWTTNTVSGNYNGFTTVHSVKYLNGKWFTCNTFDNNYGNVSWVDSISNSGWSGKNVFVGIGRASIKDIAYANTRYVAVGHCTTEDSQYLSCAYTSSLSGTWNTCGIFNNLGDNGNCIIVRDGKFIVGGSYQSGNYVYAAIAYVATSSTPNSWSNKYLWRSRYSGNAIKCITHINGYYVACGKFAYNDSNAYGQISYTTSLSATWNNNDLWRANANTSANSIAYHNGYYVVVGQFSEGSTSYARIAYFTSFGATITMKDLWSSNNSATAVNGVICSDGVLVAAGTLGGSGFSHRGKIAYDDSDVPFDAL